MLCDAGHAASRPAAALALISMGLDWPPRSARFAIPSSCSRSMIKCTTTMCLANHHGTPQNWYPRAPRARTRRRVALGSISSRTNAHVTSELESGEIQPRIKECSGLRPNCEPIGCSRQPRKDHSSREMLQLRHNACGARAPTVVQQIVAVPSGTGSSAHLHEPLPNIASRAPNSNGVGQRSNGFGNEFVGGEPPTSLATVSPHRPPRARYPCGSKKQRAC